MSWVVWERNKVSGLGNPVNHSQDGSVALRWGETRENRDEIQGYVGQAVVAEDQPELAVESYSEHSSVECHHRARGGKDDLGLWGGTRGAIAAGQCIRLDILGFRPIQEGEVELCELQGLFGLPGVEVLGSAEIIQVLVVGPHDE
jgi:hypothetical protein